jgi:hypothetical protein
MEMCVKIEWKNIILNLLKGGNLHLLTALLSPHIINRNNIGSYVHYHINDFILDEKLLLEKSLSKDELNKEISSEELDNNEQINIDELNKSKLSNGESSTETENHNIFPTAVVVGSITSVIASNAIIDEEYHNDIPEAVPINEE